jgi:hypothetical protein
MSYSDSCTEPEKQGDAGKRDRTEGEGGWQGVSESARFVTNRSWVMVWRETGTVRNARASRGQAALTRKRTQWNEDEELPIRFQSPQVSSCFQEPVLLFLRSSTVLFRNL